MHILILSILLTIFYFILRSLMRADIDLRLKKTAFSLLVALFVYLAYAIAKSAYCGQVQCGIWVCSYHSLSCCADCISAWQWAGQRFILYLLPLLSALFLFGFLSKEAEEE